MNYNKLPKEIWLYIFHFVYPFKYKNITYFKSDPKYENNNIINICLTCKIFNNIINSKQFEINNYWVRDTKYKHNKNISKIFNIMMTKIIKCGCPLDIFKQLVKIHEGSYFFNQDIDNKWLYQGRNDCITYINNKYSMNIIYKRSYTKKTIYTEVCNLSKKRKWGTINSIINNY